MILIQYKGFNDEEDNEEEEDELENSEKDIDIGLDIKDIEDNYKKIINDVRDIKTEENELEVKKNFEKTKLKSLYNKENNNKYINKKGKNKEKFDDKKDFQNKETKNKIDFSKILNEKLKPKDKCKRNNKIYKPKLKKITEQSINKEKISNMKDIEDYILIRDIMAKYIYY